MNTASALARRHDPQLPYTRAIQEALGDIDEAERVATFVASDETVDRYGDIVSVDGWDLTNFRKNPVVLWMHSQWNPIGKASVKIEGGQLLATIRFYDAGDSKLADDLWKLVKKRQLRGVSVGFTVPSEDDVEPIRDENDRLTGFRFLRQELLEISLVSVPANPNALQIARSMGLPPELIQAALPLDALVQAEQLKYRQRLAELRLAGIAASAPR
jgi:HK97 family phage prohead protease